MVSARSVGRHFAAQQHLVADHHRADRVRIVVGERDGGIDLLAGLAAGLLDSQMPCSTLRPCLAASAGDLLEPLVDRIDAHAIGQPGELGQVLVDLGGGDMGSGVERRLAAAERGVGQAIELFPGVKRGMRHGTGRPARPRRRQSTSADAARQARPRRIGRSSSAEGRQTGLSCGAGGAKRAAFARRPRRRWTKPAVTAKFCRPVSCQTGGQACRLVRISIF